MADTCFPRHKTSISTSFPSHTHAHKPVVLIRVAETFVGMMLCVLSCVESTMLVFP